MAFKFESLRVWQQAVELSGRIADLVKGFPIEERFVLSSQIKRAADSVALNIAEGSTGQSDAEFGRFLGMAIRSGVEVVGCLYLARKRNLIDEGQFSFFHKYLDALIRDIQALRNSLN